MPLFSHLLSDYPLNLSLLEHVHACPLTWFYIAGLHSPHMILISPLLHNGPLPISFYQRYCANSCSSACVPLAGKSPFGLTPARASLREFRLPIDEHLTTPIEHRCANPLNSISLRCGLRCCYVLLLGFVFKLRSALRLCRPV